VDAVYAFFAYSVSQTHAEDLTSATFEKVIRSWRRYDSKRSAERTWILAIARNQLIDHFRRQSHRDAISIDEYPLIAESLSAPEAIERRLDADEVRGWLAGLSDREQHALALRYGADLTARDIAELLELSEANVHQILSRSLRRLRNTAQRTLT
jgi:RNA polymerase sigma-70 factor (ECF subfamily)